MNKKGQSLSINTIIIAIIAITVLVVLVMIFTGAMGEWVNKIKGLQKEAKCVGTDADKAKYKVIGGTLKESCDTNEIPYYNTVDGTEKDEICCVTKK